LGGRYGFFPDTSGARVIQVSIRNFSESVTRLQRLLANNKERLVAGQPKD
jgi:hypothetical protein